MGVPDSAFEEVLSELPPFPSVAFEMLRALSGDSDDVRIDEVIELIRSDPGVSGDLLKRANSPAYGFQSRIDSLQQCVVLLGFDEVRKLALAISTRRFAGKALKHPELERCWTNTLAVAVLAEKVGGVLGVAPEKAYTAALMHDIGRLSIFTARPNEYSELLQKAEQSGPIDDTTYFLDLEREAFGFDHTEAGHWMGEQWQFPRELQVVAGRHHDRPEPGKHGLLEVVQYAVRAADALGLGIVPTVARGELQKVFEPLPASKRDEIAGWPDLLERQVRERAGLLSKKPPAEAGGTEEEEVDADAAEEAANAAIRREAETPTEESFNWEVTAAAALVVFTLVSALVFALLR